MHHKEAPAAQSSNRQTWEKQPTNSSTPQDRHKLAELHKRIRAEKQSTGKVLSVAEAKKIVEEEKKPSNLGRKSSIASIKSRGKRD